MKQTNFISMAIIGCLTIIGCLAIAAFILSLSIVHNEIKGVKGDPGEIGETGLPGENGINGTPGENGLTGNSIRATSISKIDITNGETVSLFTQNSPYSSNAIFANTIKIGDTMKVEINLETFPSSGGTLTIDFGCTSGQLVNLVLSDNSTQTFFQVKLVVVFDTLNTVSIFRENSNIQPESKIFDTTIDQFMYLTIYAANIALCSVYNFIISQQVSILIV